MRRRRWWGASSRPRFAPERSWRREGSTTIQEEKAFSSVLLYVQAAACAITNGNQDSNGGREGLRALSGGLRTGTFWFASPLIPTVAEAGGYGGQAGLLPVEGRRRRGGRRFGRPGSYRLAP